MTGVAEVAPVSSDAERQAAYRLRYAVYVEDMGMAQARANHQERLLHDEDDASAHLLVARTGGEVTGTLRLHLGNQPAIPPRFYDTLGMEPFAEAVGPEQLSLLTRFAVHQEHRGSPVSLELLRAAAHYLVERSVVLNFLSCQPHLVNLYGRIGYLPYQAPTSDPGAGLLVPMCLNLADAHYQERLGRPLPTHPHDEAICRAVRSLVEPQPITWQAPDTHSDALWSEVYAHLHTDRAEGASLMRGFSAAEIQEVAAGGQVLRCQTGDVVIRQGNTTRTVYVVLEGLLEMRAGSQILGRAVTGDAVGEVAFLLGTARSCDVVAVGDTEVLALSEKSLTGLARDNPDLARRLMLNLARGLAWKLVERPGHDL